MDVEIEKADLPAMRRESGSEVGGDGRLADASFPAEDEDDVFHIDLGFRWQPFWGTVRLLCRSTGAAVLAAAGGIVLLVFGHR